MYYKFLILFRNCNNTHTRGDEKGKEIEKGIPGKKVFVIG
jgi:hypothetical protein